MKPHIKFSIPVIFFTCVCSILKKVIAVILDVNTFPSATSSIPFEIKNINQTDYHISKKIENNQVVKTIRYEKDGDTLEYTEKVKLLEISDFEKYLQFAGLKVEYVFGNYDLQEFTSESPRLIIVAKK